MRTYQKIRSLTSSMVEGNVTNKRKAAVALVRLLGDSKTRRRLALEGSPRSGSTPNILGARRKSLSESWKMIIMHGLQFVDSVLTGKGKAKLKPGDIEIPLKLFQYCHSYEAGIDYIEGSLLPTPPRLSRKEIRSAIKFCLSLLENDEVLRVGESTLLELLKFLCTNPDYVAYMKPVPDMQIIMEEIECRLLFDPEDPPPDKDVTAVTEIFQSLLRNATELGLGLHLLIPGCIKMVSKWMHIQVQEESLTTNVRFNSILNGLQMLMRHHPDQAIAPLKRCGRIIFEAAKHRLTCTINTGMDRNVLQQFFKTYLIVAKMAGKLEGRMSVDLGSLGKASITLEDLLSILASVCSFPETRSSPEGLEFVVSLLACSQRMYLVENAWREVDDPIKIIRKRIENDTGPCGFLETLSNEAGIAVTYSADTLSESPIFRLVLGVLGGAGGGLHGKSPHLLSGHRLVSKNDAPPNSARIALLLDILTMSARCFPLGGCWAMSAGAKWFELKGMDNPMQEEIGFLQVCTPQDLVFVIEIVGALLAKEGGPDGDRSIQKAALRCLIQLTLCSSLVLLHTRYSSGLESIEMAWKRIWAFLFASELNYSPSTKDSSVNSVGHSVLTLLSFILYTGCTDLSGSSEAPNQVSFVHSHQSDIWNLPVFQRPDMCSSTTVLELVSSFLLAADLSDRYDDVISSDSSIKSGSSRRLRLISFCVNALVALETDESVEAASCCFALLVNGDCSQTYPDWLANSTKRFRAEESTWEPPSFRIDESDALEFGARALGNPLLGILWEQLTPPLVARSFWDLIGTSSSTDSPDAILRTLWKTNESLRGRYRTTGRIKDSLVRGHHDYFVSKLESVIVPDSQQNFMSPLIIQLKMLLSVVVTRPYRDWGEHWEGIANAVAEAFRKFSSFSPADLLSLADFGLVLQSSINVLSLAAAIAPFSATFSAALASACFILENQCRSLLDLYTIGELDSVSEDIEDVNDDFGFDDENNLVDSADESLVPYSRRGDESGPPRKKSRRQHDGEVRPTQAQAFLLALLILRINPSPGNGAFVTSKLTAASHSHGFGDSDLEGAVHALVLLCTPACLIHDCSAQIHLTDEHVREATNAQIICQVAKAIRSNSASTAASPLHQFGHQIFALIAYSVGDISAAILTSEEATEVVKIACADYHSSSTRPKFKVEILASSIAAIHCQNPIFRDCCLRDFPDVFIRPSLCDVDFEVRQVALRAVSVAMRFLSGEKLVRFVGTLLPEIFEPDGCDEYQEWCGEINLGTDDHNTAEKQVWEDAMASVRWSILKCWGVLASSSNRHETVVSICVQLFYCSYNNPGLEALCLQVLRTISRSKGYEDEQSFAESYRERLVGEWLRKDEQEDLLCIPCILSIPDISRLLVEMNSLGIVDRDILQRIAASAFISKKIRIYLPRSLQLFATKSVETSVTKEVRRSLLEDKRIKDLCSVVYSHCDDTTVERLLSSYLADVLAYSTIFRAGSEKETKVAVEMERIVSSLLNANFKKIRLSRAADTVTRILDLVIGLGFVDKDSDECTEQMVSVLNFFLDSLDLSASSTEDTILRRIGSSVLDLAFSARRWLRRARNVDERRRCGKVFEILARFTPQASSMEMVLYASMMPDLMHRTKHCSTHSQIMKTIKILVNNVVALNESLNDEGAAVERFSRYTMAVLLHVHENAQQEFSDMVKHQQHSKNWALLSSLGIRNDVLPLIGVGRNPVTTANAPNEIAEQQLTLMRESFQLLETFFAQSESLNLGSLSYAALLPPYQTSISLQQDLHGVDHRLCVQKLIQAKLSTQIKTLGEDIFKKVLADENSSLSMLEVRKSCEKHSIEEHLLVVELRELKSYLQEIRNVSPYVLDRLALRVSLYCEASYPQPVRIAASACLSSIGNASPKEIENFSTNSVDQEESSVADGTLAMFLRSKCLGALAVCLRSQDEDISTIAQETVVTISQTTSLSVYSNFLEKNVVEALQPFFLFGVHRKAQPDRIRIPEAVSQKLRLKYGEDQPGLSRTLWEEGGESTLDWGSWVTTVVPLLLSNFPADPSQATRKDQSDLFLGACQRICSVAPFMAETLFPLVVLDLMGYSDSSSRPRSQRTSFISVDVNSGIFKEIQSSFNVFLECIRNRQHISNDREGCRSTEIVVDFLDLLRRLAQHSFVTSGAHRSNTSAKGSSSSKDKRKSTPVSRTVYLQGFDWYGMALACLEVRKFTASLFYLEMHSDICLQGPAKGLTELSGNQALLQKAENIKVYSRALEFLRESSERAALECSSSEAEFMKVGSQSSLSMRTLGPPSLSNLRNSDCWASQESPSRRTGLLTSLSSVGLHHTAGLAVSGTIALSRELANDDYVDLREKWFESCLHEFSWDNDLLNDSFDEARVYGMLEGRSIENSIIAKGSASVVEGFNECVSKSFAAILKTEWHQAATYLTSARLLLASQIPRTITESPVSSGTLNFDHLRTLDDLDLIVRSESSLAKFVVSTISPQGNADTLPLSTMLFSHRPKEYPYQEMIREAIIRTSFSKCTTSRDKNEVTATLLSHLWEQCRNGQLSTGTPQKALYRLFSLIDKHQAPQVVTESSCALICRLRLLEAVIIEKMGDFTGAIRHAREAVRRLEPIAQNEVSRTLLADALLLCGQLVSKYKVEPASRIVTKYFARASSLSEEVHREIETHETSSLASAAYLAQAQLLSSLYETVSSRVKSMDWDKGGKTLEKREQELKECSKVIQEEILRQRKESSNVEDLKHKQIYEMQLSKSVAMARSQREEVERSVESYRAQAVRAIVLALSLASSDEMMVSLYVYRLIHLWFTNEDDNSSNKNVDEAIRDAINGVPSFRFVPVSTQLLSRVELKGTSHFQGLLHTLLEKLCREHPFHCVVQLLALKNGKNVGAGVSGRNAKAYIENATDDKIKGAGQLLSQLKKDEQTQLLIESYSSISDAYVNLANFPTAELLKEKSRTFAFSRITKSSGKRLDQALGNVVDTSMLPCVLTNPPPIRPGCDYYDQHGDLIGAELVQSFDPSFSITDSGIHRPKIVVCTGSKGGKYRQLVKGEDEIRQDAVMEQVFGVVNSLLRQEDNGAGHCRPHSLRLVTYNIIPLSPACGVLEWVNQTVAFGEFMADHRGKVGAHSRYFPGEWSSGACRQKLLAASKGTPEKRRDAFNNICKNHSPVFRYFFVEKFGHCLKDWHAARTRYTRSVAINSIVGHVLGIGDRHCSNILVHKGSGEVVHIDFGIVFEQGKILNTPEVVPFRLTQNVVDGFGPAGVNGNFLSASKRTLDILRKNSNALLTILSAIQSDPLYNWSVSPVKANQRQTDTDDLEEVHVSSDNSDENMAAAHAIRRIQEKLNGYEDGTAGEQQSIEGQVQLLISSARDRDNLCLMYHGWQPWT